MVRKAIEENDPLRYPLILMDCNMPFMDGYEATEQIRKLFSDNHIQRSRQPKIIAVTGHVEQEYVKRALVSGMDKVYPKPFPIKQFGHMLLSMKLIDNVPFHL
jgi:two-component system, sensor histidine kinase RetS